MFQNKERQLLQGSSMTQHNEFAVMMLFMKKRTKFAVGPSYIGSPLIKIHVVAGNYITALKVRDVYFLTL